MTVLNPVLKFTIFVLKFVLKLTFVLNFVKIVTNLCLAGKVRHMLSTC